MVRCFWATDDPLYRRYHDEEWGIPVRSDTRLFEKLCLEGFQSGLSWLTILRKRESFRAAFSGFAIEHTGFVWFFIWTSLIGIPVALLAFFVWYRDGISDEAPIEVRAGH